MRFSLLALCLMATRAEGQRVPSAPLSVAIVEADAMPAERTRTIAALVRTRLEHHTTREQLHVWSRKNVAWLCDMICPDRWTPQDMHEVGKLLPADVMVLLTTSVQGGEVSAQVLAQRQPSMAVDTLPRVRGVADTAVASELAGKLSEMLQRLDEQKLDSAPGAARVVSVPTHAYLVDVMRKRGSESPLGDLRRRATAPDDVEVRAWGGFGLTGISGVVLRRERGAWRAWRAVVVNADTLAIREVKADARAIEGAWDAAMQEGLLTLPAEVVRKWVMLDGFTYVIEVRRGAEYRASSIEHVGKPEVPADAQVKRVFEALTRLVPVAPARIPGP